MKTTKYVTTGGSVQHKQAGVTSSGTAFTSSVYNAVVSKCNETTARDTHCVTEIPKQNKNTHIRTLIF
jgi:hypothetical protein